jgi:hypothetical protein
VIFSLKNEPMGATIDQNLGKFVWTPSKSHGSYQDVKYNFDIIATKEGQEDIESITITVEKAYVEPEIKSNSQVLEPEIQRDVKESKLASFVDETKDPQSYVDRYNNEVIYKEWFDENYIQYSSIYEAVGLEEPLKIPASFVDETKDPQSYVDRYNNEVIYKEWFDENYIQYSSIYEAVGLEEPLKIPASFVDETKDPQSYVDRYNNEVIYKEWFDENYIQYSSIYEAVGLEESVVIAPEFGECGEGTKLIDGKCAIIESKKADGGCLIATATYGSEMSTQVQQLREIRDNQLLNTESGISFINLFNDVYYSFSPIVADYERENPLFKEVVKLFITPMISSLSIMSYADSDSEVLGYGISVILMNLGMYLVSPVMLFYVIKKIKRVKF